MQLHILTNYEGYKRGDTFTKEELQKLKGPYRYFSACIHITGQHPEIYKYAAKSETVLHKMLDAEFVPNTKFHIEETITTPLQDYRSK